MDGTYRSRELKIEKNKILFFVSSMFFIASIDLVFIYILPIEDLKYAFLLNVLLSVFCYFKMFGKLWHPVFIFIGTLTLFQCGLIIASTFIKNIDLCYVWAQEANLFLEEGPVRLTVLLISLSYWFLLIGAYLGNKKKIKQGNSKKRRCYDCNFLKNLFFVIFFIVMPFYFYKQLSYFNYFKYHGYIGFYQSTEFKGDVSLLVRIISLFEPIAFLGYFFLEKNKKFVFLISLIYFIITIPILLCGFRSEFFTFWLTVFLFYNYKFNNKLKIKTLAILIIIISVVGALISYSRTYLSYNLEFILKENPIMGFLVEQGIPFHVTAMAIEFKKEFAPNIFKYLMWEPICNIFPTALNVPGRAFSTDIMIKINYKRYLMGNGIGSSYLAEAYLLGGSVNVCLISFFIGYILSILYKCFEYANVYIKILIFQLMQYIFFLPRDLLLRPLSVAIEVSALLLFLFLVVNFRFFRHFNGSADAVE